MHMELPTQSENSSKPAAKMGLIAGGGVLPKLQAQGMRQAGCQVICVGLSGQYDADMPELCDQFKEVGVLRPGQWTRTFRKWGVDRAVMVGEVRKHHLSYASLWKLFSKLPDRHALDLWFRVLRHDRRSQTGLAALADKLQKQGLTLIETTQYIPDHLATLGVMGQVQPNPQQQADIEFGWSILMGLNELQVGQALAIKDRDVLAVEAIEGTAAMIERAGQHCSKGGWTLLKGADPSKDKRFDVPFVGAKTIEQMKEAGCKCLAVTAGSVILAEKPGFLKRCDEAGIAVVGLDAKEQTQV